MKNILELEIALQDGMDAKLKDGRIIITIDTEKTKRDLRTGQLECWLTRKDEVKTLSSGYMRIIKDKLSFIKWQ